MKTLWNQRKVLVTGATGLVGSWLIKALIDRNADVVTLIRDPNPQSEFCLSGDDKKVNLVQGSLEDFSSVERAINEYEIETVFHLGAQTIVGTAWRNPLSTFESNIRGTYHVLEACRRHKDLVHEIIIASSDKAYGSDAVLPYVETAPLAGRHPYEVSKSCADLISQSYYHTYQLPVAIARCGNTYGGGDLNWSRLIPGAIRSYLFNKPLVIRSDGKFTRDYIYVEDVVNAYLSLAENLQRPEIQGQSFNFGPDSPHSVQEIVQTLQHLMNTEHLKSQILDNAKNEIRNQSLNSNKARELLHWRCGYTLEEGLSKTIEWYQNWIGSKQMIAQR